MTRLKIMLSVFVPLILGAVVIISSAQVCTPQVIEALELVSQNCSGLGLNEACYGYNRVEATFQGEVPPNYFTEPADRADLALLETIRTSGFNNSSGEWGIALLKARPNMPNTAPGQHVLFLLMGDVEMRSAVTDANRAEPAAAPLEVTASINANVRAEPSLNGAVLGGLRSGMSLLADGLSPDGEWVRVTYNRRVAWLSRAVLADLPEIATLPTVSPQMYTAMQAFYFQMGGIGLSDCQEAPSTLVVQGPNDLTIRINANGVDIDISSTIALQTYDGRMEVSVLSGSASVDGIRVPRGFSVSAPLDAETGLKTGYWSAVQPMSDGLLNSYSTLENVNAGLLHYAITLPTAEEIAETERELNAADTPDSCASACQIDPEATDEAGGMSGTNFCPGNSCNSNGVPGGNPPGDGQQDDDGADGDFGDDNCPGNSCNSNGVPGGNPPGGGNNNCPGNSCNSNGVPGGNPPGGGNNNCPGNSCNSNGVPGGNPPDGGQDNGDD